MENHEHTTLESAKPEAKPEAKKDLRILVSPRAIEEIEKMQAKRTADGKKAEGLRVGIRGGGCTGFGYLFEWSDVPPKPTDKVFEFADGRVKVFCDPKSLIYLDGTTLDFTSGIAGHGFKFINPNVKSSCGCGESVSF